MAVKSDGQVIIDTRIDSSGFDRGLNTVKQKMGAFSGALNKLGNTIKNTFSDQSSKIAGKSYADLQKEIAKAERQLDKLIEKQIRFVETGGNTKSRSFAGMEYDIEMARNNLDGLRKELAELGEESPRKISFLRKMIDKLKKSFSSLSKSTKSSHKSMLKMLGTSLLFSTVFRAISAVTKGFTEGINNLTRYSDEANVTMSALKSSLTQLKNGFAVAFMPLITSVTPILTKFMDVISSATNKVSAFFAALSGKSTYTKAIAVQEDYAASLKDTADSAKEANKYLSGLDEIRTFTEPNSTKAGSVSPANMFSQESVASPISNFAAILKEKFENSDWKGIGALLAEKLNTVFSGIDFSAAGSGFGETIKNIIDVITGFLEEIDWQMLGNKCAEFIAAIDWSGIVSSISEGIGAALGGLAGFIWGFIEEAWNSVVKWWQENAYKDGEFTIQGLLNGIWEGIKNIGTWITDHIFTPFMDGFKKAFGIHSPSTVMAEMGRYMMQGLFNGITSLVDKVVQIFEKVKTKITSVWNDIKIQTSTVWATIKTSLTNTWNSLKSNVSTFANNVKNTIVNAWNSMKTKVTNIWNGIITSIKNSINKIIYVINRMIYGMVDGVNSLIGALNSLSFSFPDWIPGLGGQSFGLNIGYVSAPYIPYLASGAVIPPNAPFMAVLGDQKHGTNIEAPLDTIKQAVREVVGGSGGGNVLHNVVQINRRTLLEEMIEEAKLRQSASGRNPFELA